MFSTDWSRLQHRLSPSYMATALSLVQILPESLWDLRYSVFLCLIHVVIPAKAGIQFRVAGVVALKNWIPAFPGMTRCPGEHSRTDDESPPCRR